MLAAVPGRIPAVLLLPTLLVLASSSTRDTDDYGEGALLAMLENPPVADTSGLVASRQNPDVLWTHNHSGDDPRLYATDRYGRSLGTFVVPGATNVDWEDLAIGPGADGTAALYVADTGDNQRRRADPAIYRIPEPALSGEQSAPSDEPTSTAVAERFPIANSEGPHDIETLLVHPESGEIVLVTKEMLDPAKIYHLPALPRPGQKATLLRVGDLPLPRLGPASAATGGAVSPDGARLAIRTPIAAFEWDIAPTQSLADALRHPPRRVALPLTPRGEAIAYRADGAALLFTEERSPCPLYEVSEVVSSVSGDTAVRPGVAEDRPGLGKFDRS